MYIDPKTLLFVEMSNQEEFELLAWAENVVLTGMTHGHPKWIDDRIDEWLNAAGLEVSNRLLAISTVIPQRVLISIIRSRAERSVIPPMIQSTKE